MTEWMEISTAPKGAEIVLYFPETPAGRNNLPAMVRVERYPVSFPRQPSHWMPLPSPPTPTNDTQSKTLARAV